jgi:hypothetical protein
MNKQTILTAMLTVCILLLLGTQANSISNPGVPTITVTQLDINEKTLELTYKIRNDSADDIWILTGGHLHSVSTFGMGTGVHVTEDGRTLTIGIRFNRSSTVMTPIPIYGRFIRLRSGESQIESIFMEIPVYPAPQSGSIRQQGQGIHIASRLAIELGYCP